MARERLGYIDIKYIGIEKNVTMINMYIYIFHFGLNIVDLVYVGRHGTSYTARI